MTKYITQISKEDFRKIFPYYPLDKSSSSFPQVVAIIDDSYPSLPNHPIEHVNILKVKHVYSTRDYWEVLPHGKTKRERIPKRYTNAIYLIEED